LAGLVPNFNPINGLEIFQLTAFGNKLVLYKYPSFSCCAVLAFPGQPAEVVRFDMNFFEQHINEEG
jgi:hypothetical protein